MNSDTETETAKIEDAPVSAAVALVAAEGVWEDLIPEVVQALRRAACVIARRVYADHGYLVPEGYDFSAATHPQEIAAYRSAVGAIDIVREWLIDECGSDFYDQLTDSYNPAFDFAAEE